MVMCRDLMTEELVVCTTTDSVAEVAQKMRSADVGSLPVMEATRSRKLIGIITDRDLALRVIGDQLDPNTTKAGQVMSTTLVTCYLDDDIGLAMRKMSDRQVRRIPVVNKKGEIMGIIAQADIARHTDARTAGEVVEDISREPARRGR